MKKRIRTHTNPLNIRQRITDVSLDALARDYLAVDLDIGFGRGRFMSSYANRHPNRFVVGIEVRKQMVMAFKDRYSIENCLPIWGAAAICMEDAIPDASLSRVFIFHPDPWFKKRHHKRRVLNDHLLNLIREKMVPGGRLYVSTDVTELHNDMLNLCEIYGNLEFVTDDLFWQTDYATHWSMFAENEQRPQHFLTVQFKETL